MTGDNILSWSMTPTMSPPLPLVMARSPSLKRTALRSVTSTVNQAGDKSIALPADVVPSAPGDGKLTIEDADGNELGSFTANQADGVDTVVTLPEIPEVTGFVKLDDEGTQQSITGGGGLDEGRHKSESALTQHSWATLPH